MRPITTLIALLVGLLCLPAAAQAQQTFKAGAVTYVLDENQCKQALATPSQGCVPTTWASPRAGSR